MNRVAIVAGKRTAFAKATKELRDIGVVDLTAHAIDGLLRTVGFTPDQVEELHVGSVVYPGPGSALGIGASSAKLPA